MLAVGPLGPQYSLLFAWHELGSKMNVSEYFWQKISKKILLPKIKEGKITSVKPNSEFSKYSALRACQH